MEICFHIKLFPVNAFIHPLPNIIFMKMKYSHRKTAESHVYYPRGNILQWCSASLLQRSPPDPSKAAWKSTLPTSPIRVKRNRHQYLRVLNSSIQTFHCVNETIKNSWTGTSNTALSIFYSSSIYFALTICARLPANISEKIKLQSIPNTVT